LNTAWTSYVERKARMLKLFSILQHWFLNQQNAWSYIFIFHKFYCIASGLKIMGQGNRDNNLGKGSRIIY
jgi:hypothetical protein